MDGRIGVLKLQKMMQEWFGKMGMLALFVAWKSIIHKEREVNIR
jgi:hypothetical protein